MSDLQDQLVVFISKILICASNKLFSLISDQTNTPGVGVFLVWLVCFFVTKYHRNGLSGNLHSICKTALGIYILLCTFSCLDFPTCTKGSVMLLRCLLVLRGGCFKMNSAGNLFSFKSALHQKSL